MLIKHRKDPNDYLYLKEIMKPIDVTSHKGSLNKSVSKERYLQFIHKTNGEIIELLV